MNASDARDLAYQWHGGMWSPLYAFYRSGEVEDLDVLLEEIDALREYQRSQILERPGDDDPVVQLRDLDDLRSFITNPRETSI